MQTIRSLVAGSLALATLCYAVETRSWTQNEQADFEKGTLKNLSLRSDGRLTLAPAIRELLDSGTPYLWALAEDSKGNIYAGGGGPSASSAKLMAVDPAGKTRTLAELNGMEIHAIAVDRKDQVFAATSPDGKVYKVDASGKADVFYDPKAKYVWAMVFNSKGDLFIATGDQGEIHRVTPTGQGSVFFKTEETHARSLTIDRADNLIVGTEPGGLILRVSPAGEGFVVYQAAKREVTAVAVAKDGSIYAAAVGNRTATPTPSTSTTPLTIPPIPPTPLPGGGQRRETGAAPGAGPVAAPAVPASISGGSEVYRIDKDNYPRRVWTHSTDIAYSIGFDGDGRPIVGTGNKGNVYRIDSDVRWTLLVNAVPTQVTTLWNGSKGRLLAATGNTGKVFQIGPGYEKQGTFESETFDVGSFAYWGRMHLLADGAVKVETRSGNLDRPQKNWSNWAPVENGARATSPSARFLQYRLTLTAAADGKSPLVSEVDIAYMAKNVAPVVEEIEITPANYRFPPQSLSVTPTQTITLPALGRRRASRVSLDTISSTQTMNYAKGHVGARWSVTDANNDDMVFTVEIRGINESQWKLLKDKVKERYFSWDSTTLPDGEYQVRVTAFDSPDNPPDQALSATLESDPFVIDNTPPKLTGLVGARAGNNLTVKWKAADQLSVISSAEYSLNGGDWTPVQPTTRLSDSPEHDYSLTLPAGAGEQTVAIRVTDDSDNQAVDKVVIR